VSRGAAGRAAISVHNRLGANRQALSRVQDKVGSDQALASAILDADRPNRVWAGGLGQWEDADERHGLSGYRYDSYGVMAGYDRMFGPFTLGGAFGYSGGDFEDKGAVAHDSSIENYAFNLYAAYNHASGFFASLVGGHVYSRNDINEFDGINWGREDYHTGTWELGAKIGHDVRPAPCLTLSPSIGLTYVNSRNSAHDLNYGGINLLSYDTMKNRSTQLPLDLSIAYDIAGADSSVFTLKGNVGYSYDFNDEGIEGSIVMNGLNGAGSLSARGREPGRHAVNLGLGCKYVRGCLDAGLQYDYFAKADYQAHRLVGSIGVSF
jgi:outer membrane autotransporter protein